MSPVFFSTIGPSYRQTRLPLVLASTTSGLLETKNSPPKNSPPRDSPPKDSSPGASSIQPTSKSTASMTPPTSTALLTPPTTDCTGLGVVVTPGSGRLVLVTATPFNTIPVTAGATPVKMAAPTNTSPVGAASLGSVSCYDCLEPETYHSLFPLPSSPLLPRLQRPSLPRRNGRYRKQKGKESRQK